MAKKVKRFLLVIVSVMMLAVCGVFMTACGKPGDVAASSIVYDGDTIKWGAVKNAASYVVTIDGKTHTTSSTEYPHSAKASTKSVEVSVYALNKKDKQGATASRTFTRLETIQTSAITFTADGVMSWEGVEDADEYELKINDEIVSTAALEWDEFVYGQENKIQIRPVTTDNSTFSSWSKTISKHYLGAPTEISYDGVTLKWRGQKIARGYNIYIDGNLAFNVTGSTNTYDYDAEQQSFEVAVQAVGDNVENGSVFTSPISEDKSFTFLPIITRDEMEVEDGVLNWDAVEEADAYQLEINGVKQTQYQKETSYEVPAGTQTKIRVKPVLNEGDVYFSDFSEEIDIYILQAPVVSWNGFELADGEEKNVIDWSQVSGAVGGYTVKIVMPDGTENYEEYGELQREFPYAFLTAGKYELSVKATADDADVYDSKFSTPFTVTRLPSPTALVQGSIKSNPTNLAEGFTWTWQNVYGASGYQIYKEGLAISALDTNNAYSKTITNIVDETVTEKTEITYTVQSKGSVSGRTIFLPSITNPDKATVLTQKITVQPMPRDLTFDGFFLKWTGTENAQKYAVRHSGNSAPASETSTQWDMQTLNAGTHYVSVCAQGNGGATLASNYTEEKTVERLPKPYDLKIGTKVSEGYLQWVGNDNAQSYLITIRGGQDPIETKSSINIADKISTQGTALGVTAKANYPSADGTVYYITSEESEVKTFKKLEAPTFNEVLVSERKLLWNAPANAGKFTPSYQLMKGSGMSYDGYLSGAEKTLDPSEFPAGSYTFKVKAFGNETEFINSDVSKTCQFRILETPDVKVGDTAYEWASVDYAQSYQVFVDGKFQTDIPASAGVNDKFSWTPEVFRDITSNGYQVSITAIGDGGKTLVDSVPNSFNQRTERLSTPMITLGYSETDNRYTENGKVTVTVNSAVPFANGYVYTINGSSYPKKADELKFELDPNTTGVLPVSVRAVGGKFNTSASTKPGEAVYYLDSPETTSPSQITILHAPSSETITISTTAISWAYIDGADSYDVEITYADGTTQTINVAVNGVSKNQLKDGQTMNTVRKVKVSACGSKNQNEVSSAWSEQTFSAQ